MIPNLAGIEINRIDLMLTDLRRQWQAANQDEKQYVFARIDYWLDRRLDLM